LPFGLFSLIYGLSRITLGVQLHQAGRPLRAPSALRTAAWAPAPGARAGLLAPAPVSSLRDGGTLTLKHDPPTGVSPLRRPHGTPLPAGPVASPGKPWTAPV